MNKIRRSSGQEKRQETCFIVGCTSGVGRSLLIFVCRYLHFRKARGKRYTALSRKSNRKVERQFPHCFLPHSTERGVLQNIRT